MTLCRYLETVRRKTITYQDLKKAAGCDSEESLYHEVKQCVEAGLLSPVASSKTNGNVLFPIYLKYRILAKADESETEKDQISKLHPILLESGLFQRKPAEYQRYKEQIQRLNAWLFSHMDSPIPISRKERSFEIFGEEKQLEDPSFVSLLKRLGVTPDCLSYYDTPEYCFNDYIPKRKECMVLLILENKDIWFNIRRRMYEDGAMEILGTRIDGAVYGAGNRVSEAGALSEYTRFMGAKTVKYLYWGDIDRAGLDIFQSLSKNNPEIDIRLFVPAYAEMLRLSKACEIPDSNDHRERMGNYEDIYALFSDEDKNQMIKLIENNKRLPQEIINYESLLKMMR